MDVRNPNKLNMKDITSFHQHTVHHPDLYFLLSPSGGWPWLTRHCKVVPDGDGEVTALAPLTRLSPWPWGTTYRTDGQSDPLLGPSKRAGGRTWHFAQFDMVRSWSHNLR